MIVENELKKEDKIEKLQTYDSGLFIGESYFFNDMLRLSFKWYQDANFC